MKIEQEFKKFMTNQHKEVPVDSEAYMEMRLAFYLGYSSTESLRLDKELAEKLLEAMTMSINSGINIGASLDRAVKKLDEQ